MEYGLGEMHNLRDENYTTCINKKEDRIQPFKNCDITIQLYSIFLKIC